MFRLCLPFYTRSYSTEILTCLSLEYLASTQSVYQSKYAELAARLESLRQSPIPKGTFQFERDAEIESLQHQANTVYSQLVFGNPRVEYEWKFKKSNKLLVPKFSEMSNDLWRREHGPLLTRTLAKKYSLLDFLPYETEIAIPIHTRFNNDSAIAGRGNLILPEWTRNQPVFQYQLEPEPLSHTTSTSILLVDLDNPNETVGRLEPFVLGWFSKASSLIPYMPPHPQRGSGTHRILTLLLEHSSEVQSQNTSICDKHRFFDLKSYLMHENAPRILSYNWFTSTWTRAVSAIYQEDLKCSEIAYGESISHHPDSIN